MVVVEGVLFNRMTSCVSIHERMYPFLGIRVCYTPRHAGSLWKEAVYDDFHFHYHPRGCTRQARHEQRTAQLARNATMNPRTARVSSLVNSDEYISTSKATTVFTYKPREWKKDAMMVMLVTLVCGHPVHDVRPQGVVSVGSCRAGMSER